MKKNLLFLFFASIIVLSASSQVTLLSNNTSYEWGYPLTNNLLILRSQLSNTLWVYNISGNSFTQLSSTVTVQSDYSTGFMNGEMYFEGQTAVEGIELWKTDGTPGGTGLVKNINPGAADSEPKYGFIVYNSELYFTAKDATTGRELWKTDGTTGGTVQVKDINTGPGDGIPDPNPIAGIAAPEFGVINGLLVFTALTPANGQELWKTNGTDPGTALVKNIYSDVPTPYGSYISNFTEYGGNLLFTAYDDINGDALWKTDGTTAGTDTIKDIDVITPPLPPPFYFLQPSITPQFLNFQSTLYFVANDGNVGWELWKTNGTTGGTSLVKDINPGADDAFPFGFSQVPLAVKTSTKFFFGATTANEGQELWQSDGTGSGTTRLTDVETGPSGSEVFVLSDFYGGGLLPGNKFFFMATEPGVGSEYYLTDGTSGLTAPLVDINPGPPSGAAPNPWIYTNNKFFFNADNGVNGVELWKSDGTVGGTAMVQDINTAGTNGSDSSDISQFIVASNILFFFGTDGDDPTKTDFFRLDGTLLPLRWISFTAKPLDNDVLLSWQTAEEENTDHFIIERSSDGSHYSEIGRVNAQGTISNYYQFKDAGAMTKTGVKKWYYRIRQVDKDGKAALSKIASVALNKTIASILITPNPANNELKLLIEAVSNDHGVVSIVNMTGKTVWQKAISIRKGENRISEDVSKLPAGAYILQITTETSSSAERFLIQH